MKTIKIKVKAINGNEYTWKFTEYEKDTTDYGNGIYIGVSINGERSLIDARYIVEYNFVNVCETYIKNYYGKNLVSYEVVQ